ncbi:uncharacterized protein LOC135347233 [Halichondria panicea]|uniref:uncharacterized protein LOC135347233 n=1 Tax=Halichondria panicea TaxID=6063 RepID=UPI00312BC919
MMEEKLESVARYKEALEAVNELKGLQEIRLSLESLEGAQEGMSDLMGEVDSAREDSLVLKRMSEEAQHWMNKLDEAEQTFQELSVPLDYSDLKKVNFFSRAFGLDFKITEDRAISFMFLHLNDKCPDRRCSITMDIEGEKWTVVCMDPPLHGVQCLLDQLNEGGELKIFCKQVRQKFKDLISQTNLTQTD